ncbi:carbohydrate sulfotransferase 12-like [Cyprinodon tularosa]|uniref:carbohydrate sulfotransferase 12-like n=1 Tax=Cyprinodon tularosa TaxID=77115 RepID=UPI0018E276EE|nr:carbohydrate sulfotransferase 12-like [Cyprinodon tularosa]
MRIKKEYLALLVVFGTVFIIRLFFTQQGISQVAGQKTTQLQKLRKDYIRRMCDIEKKALSAQKPRIKNIYDHFIVEERQKIIYCFIPKVACSNWKRVMFVLKKGKPYDDPASIDPINVHRISKLQYLTQFNSTERKNRLMNYTKFMFVRDPFVRLISAYRSKFLYNQKNEYFYRKYGRIMMKLYGNQQNPPQTMKEAEALGLLPTFKNFVQYLVDPQTEKKEPFEPHWRQMHRLCHPCLIEYDFIGHQETLKEDAEELLKHFKLENDIKFPSPFKNMTTSNLAMDWFKAVPLEDRRKLYNIFELDFKLFGYKRPAKLLDG